MRAMAKHFCGLVHFLAATFALTTGIKLTQLTRLSQYQSYSLKQCPRRRGEELMDEKAAEALMAKSNENLSPSTYFLPSRGTDGKGHSLGNAGLLSTRKEF